MFKEKRKRFFKYLAIAMLGFAVVGYFAGFFTARFEAGAVPLAVPLLIGAITALALIYFTWDYFRRVDELDLMDNLWSHLIGQYGALLLFLGWYFLAELGVTSTYPTAIAVILTMGGTTFIAYGLRKLGWR